MRAINLLMAVLSCFASFSASLGDVGPESFSILVNHKSVDCRRVGASRLVLCHGFGAAGFLLWDHSSVMSFYTPYFWDDEEEFICNIEINDHPFAEYDHWQTRIYQKDHIFSLDINSVLSGFREALLESIDDDDQKALLKLFPLVRSFRQQFNAQKNELDDISVDQKVVIENCCGFRSFLESRREEVEGADPHIRRIGDKGFDRLTKNRFERLSHVFGEVVVDEDIAMLVVEDLLKIEGLSFAVDDGCTERAHLICWHLQQGGYKSGKIWLKGRDLSPKIYPGLCWDFHVAPIIYIENEGVQKIWVIDPVLCDDGALTTKEWFSLCGVKHPPKRAHYPLPINANLFAHAIYCLSSHIPLGPYYCPNNDDFVQLVDRVRSTFDEQ